MKNVFISFLQGLITFDEAIEYIATLNDSEILDFFDEAIKYLGNQYNKSMEMIEHGKRISSYPRLGTWLIQ